MDSKVHPQRYRDTARLAEEIPYPQKGEAAGRRTGSLVARKSKS